MTYPEGTRLVVWYSHLPSIADYPCFATVLPDGSAHVHFRNGNKTVSAKGRAIVRESAAKCAERMLEALRNVLPLLEQGTTAIPDDEEAFGFSDYEDAIVDIKTLIAEAEGKDAK